MKHKSSKNGHQSELFRMRRQMIEIRSLISQIEMLDDLIAANLAAGEAFMADQFRIKKAAFQKELSIVLETERPKAALVLVKKDSEPREVLTIRKSPRSAGKSATVSQKT